MSRTGVDGTTPVQSVISETSTPAPSVISGTIIDGTSSPTCGIIGTNTSPPSSGLWILRIGNIRQSDSPNFRKSDELNADINRDFSNDPIATPIITQVLCDELSNRSIRDINSLCRTNLVTESVNPVAPQFLNHGLSTVDTLDKITTFWIPNTRIRSLPNITHWSAVDHTVGQGATVGEALGDIPDYIEENNKTDFETCMENSKLQFKC